jgi:hypothetical protein
MIKHKIYGNVSPRVSLVYSGGESKDIILERHFKRALEIHLLQDQYIGFNVGSAILLGSAPIT